jgi:SAM-dependent methyltransferase
VDDPQPESNYAEDGVSQLEIIWGDGFLSPGGVDEVDLIVTGAGVEGAVVLDIGCGTGGAALALAAGHRARSVVGIDIEGYVVDEASRRAGARGMTDQVRFLRVEPGPLPFPDESFDVVFSKDAIVHVSDKDALYAEAFRVLRPGGRLRVGDWLRGEGSELDTLVDEFIRSSGEDFYMQTLGQLCDVVTSVGFVDVDGLDRCEWYHLQAREELAQLREQLHEPFIARLGPDTYSATIEFWQILVDSTQRGVLRPGHVRARKPG